MHLLDSRPLSDTLSALLGQRSKALQLNLSWRVDDETPAEYSTTTGLVMIGHAKLPLLTYLFDGIILGKSRKPFREPLELSPRQSVQLDGFSRTAETTLH